MKVFLTGGTGMLGRAVRNRLEASNHKVFSFGSKDFDLVDDPHKVIKKLYLVNPDVVVHCAGTVGGVKANIESPATFLRENLLMGMNLLQGMAEAGVKRIINIGTNCSYPDPEHTLNAVKERDLWNGKPHWTHAPYGLAKRMVMEACESYKNQYGIDHLTLCVANIYGPGATYDKNRSHVIPGLVRLFVEAREKRYKSVTLWGTGESSRRFLFVEDAARAVEMFLEKKMIENVINVVSSTRTKISELAELISDKVGYQGEILWDKTNPDGQWSREIDGSLAHFYGWEERVRIQDGIETVIEDYERTQLAVAR